jgi:hypothetical protein
VDGYERLWSGARAAAAKNKACSSALLRDR